MIKRSRLAIYTFLAVFISISLVATIGVPVLLDIVQNNYFRLQADINERQARAMAQFIEKQLEAGRPEEEILADFQASIQGSEMDRGFVCIVDQKSTSLISHPVAAILGTPIESMMAYLDQDYDGQDLERWESVIQEGISSGGLLSFEEENAHQEVVSFYSIDELNWTISSHENTARINSEIAQWKRVIIIASFLFALLLAFPISFSVRRVSRSYENAILSEQEKSDKLLLNILPESIALRMKNREETIVDYFPEASVLFCDIVNFTPLSSSMPPDELVVLLNQVFSGFDNLCKKFKVEKIKTIGDSYMAVAGVPEPVKNPTARLALMALAMHRYIKKVNPDLDVRIGLHTGEVVAGVIGNQKFTYDLWGDTVNIAARLESYGEACSIHCSEIVYQKLKKKFEFKDLGISLIKGKGEMHTYSLIKGKGSLKE